MGEAQPYFMYIIFNKGANPVEKDGIRVVRQKYWNIYCDMKLLEYTFFLE
jgi:hypothetical protein